MHILKTQLKVAHTGTQHQIFSQEGLPLIIQIIIQITIPHHRKGRQFRILQNIQVAIILS
jgi:hypothetical protein